MESRLCGSEFSYMYTLQDNASSNSENGAAGGSRDTGRSSGIGFSTGVYALRLCVYAFMGGAYFPLTIAPWEL